MRLMLTVLVLLALCCGGCASGDVVKNGDFAKTAAGNEDAPADWDLPPGGQWQRLAEGGPDGKACLVYEAEAVAAEPVSQRCDYCGPNSTYELRAMIRTDGELSPLLRVIDVPSRDELLAVVVSSGLQWSTMSGRFETLSADIAIEIYADQRHAAGEESPAGKVWVADVQVVPVGGQVEARQNLDIGENVALGKPYTLTAPSYGLCSDPDDKVQLTDGVYTEGHFWTRKTTVGWSGIKGKHISIDLGQNYPIKGVSFNTAAGVAQVWWPKRILVFVSDDGEGWYEAGELVALSRLHDSLPAQGEYSVQRLWTDQLRTHGRYVQLYVEPDRQYLFVDEIEVYRGEDEWVDEAREGEPITGLEEYMARQALDGLIRQQLLRDLEAAKADIADLPAQLRESLGRRALALTDAVREMPSVPMEGFRAVLPMTDLERDIFRLQAATWRAQDKALLRVWSNHRWDPLPPSAEPEGAASPVVVEVHMMNNEYRAGVFNLTSAADEDQRVRIRVVGLPGGDNPEYISVHEVLTVGTRHFTAVSAALPEAERVGDDYVVTVPPGMTRQVWLTFNPDDLDPGTHGGAVEIRGEGEAVMMAPIRLRIYPLRFPDETTLLVGGWSYTNGESQYGMTPDNRLELIAHLQERYVNAPWASSGAMGDGQYDEAGEMVAEPDTSNFDNWVNLWPEAKMYMVFKAVGESFAGSQMGTEEFKTKVGRWARFWADHMVEIGLEASQLAVLILDEPQRKEQHDVITAWANAMETAAPEIVTWEDPQPQDETDCLEMFAAVDVLCPYRNPFLARPDSYRELFLNQQRQGRDLWFYNADGPARSFDPFSFYLVQEWHCFKIGAKGSCFWAFGDSGGVSCWNEYPAAGNGPYCPTYIDDTSVTAAKYMEAIREGVEDYEYLTMLQGRVAELEAKGIGADRLADAKRLLATACDRVMAMEDGPNYRWDEEKDRGVADRVRVEILTALTELGRL